MNEIDNSEIVHKYVDLFNFGSFITQGPYFASPLLCFTDGSNNGNIILIDNNQNYKEIDPINNKIRDRTDLSICCRGTGSILLIMDRNGGIIHIGDPTIKPRSTRRLVCYKENEHNTYEHFFTIPVTGNKKTCSDGDLSSASLANPKSFVYCTLTNSIIVIDTYIIKKIQLGASKTLGDISTNDYFVDHVNMRFGKRKVFRHPPYIESITSGSSGYRDSSCVEWAKFSGIAIVRVNHKGDIYVLQPPNKCIRKIFFEHETMDYGKVETVYQCYNTCVDFCLDSCGCLYILSHNLSIIRITDSGDIITMTDIYDTLRKYTIYGISMAPCIKVTNNDRDVYVLTSTPKVVCRLSLVTTREFSISSLLQYRTLYDVAIVSCYE